jgi:hypothetical protein
LVFHPILSVQCIADDALVVILHGATVFFSVPLGLLTVLKNKFDRVTLFYTLTANEVAITPMEVWAYNKN